MLVSPKCSEVRCNIRCWRLQYVSHRQRVICFLTFYIWSELTTKSGTATVYFASIKIIYWKFVMVAISLLGYLLWNLQAPQKGFKCIVPDLLCAFVVNDPHFSPVPSSGVYLLWPYISCQTADNHCCYFPVSCMSSPHNCWLDLCSSFLLKLGIESEKAGFCSPLLILCVTKHFCVVNTLTVNSASAFHC